MDAASKMKPSELKILKEQIISEYKRKNQPQRVNHYQLIAKKFSRLAPVYFLTGLVACILMIAVNGWAEFFNLLLSGVIWITIITTALSAIAEIK